MQIFFFEKKKALEKLVFSVLVTCVCAVSFVKSKKKKKKKF
jgi:hypothetical protein